MSEIIHVSDADFEQVVLQAQLPVLVDYWAEWCGPCKQIAPVLEKLAKKFDGKVLIAKLNVDENSQVPRQYGIRGIPTLHLFVNGQVQASKVGSAPESVLEAFLNQHLA